jgi:predicted membrane-bound spermidine synthase
MRFKTLAHNIRIFNPAAAFLMTFCPTCYLFLIASRLSRVFGEDLFVYPVVAAVFILFIGLGSARRSAPAPEPEHRTPKKLIWLQMGLTFAGFFSILGIDIILFDSLAVINLEAGVFGLALAAAIGFLSGRAWREFYPPRLSSTDGARDRASVKIFSSLACAIASLLYTSVFFPAMGFFKTSLMISFINFLFVLFLFLSRHEAQPVDRLWRWGIAALVGFFLAVSLWSDKIENTVLQRAYLGHRPATLIAKDQTPSQQILLYITRKDGWPVLETEKEILARPSKYFILGLTNGALQFFLPLESRGDPGHAFLFDPHMTLRPYIKDLLILGGGDGLAARQAVQYKSAKEITVVEPDQAWVTITRENPYLRELTRRAFDDPRVKLHFMNPFEWVLRDNKHYDLIIVDAPPGGTRNLIKTKTLSLQFLRDLKRLLSKHGVIVITSNTLSSPLKMSVQARTALDAGLFPLAGSYRGKEESLGETEQLVLFHSEKSRASFLEDYKEKYRPRLEYGWKDLAKFGIISYSLPNTADHSLSGYDTLISKFPIKTRLKMITEDYASP